MTATCWKGMAARLPAWSALKEGRSKLLLAEIPNGAHVPREIAIRVGLFERRSFEELLSRVEYQHYTRVGDKTRKRRKKASPSDEDARKARANKQVEEGAYRKALEPSLAASPI
jgi:hypothetical protein